jgi:hypothetical protein
VTRKTWTVGELVRELQRAVIVDELDWDSEVLNGDLIAAELGIRRSREEDGLKIPGHAVIS